MKEFIKALVVLVFFTIPAFAGDRFVSLSVSDAIRMAAEKNLNVRAELYIPAQYEAEINRNRAIYDPLFAAQVNYSDTTTAVPNSAGIYSYRGRSLQLGSSLSQLFWSGATATLGFNNNFNRTSLNSTLPDYWQSNLAVTFSQPLLKNIGRENTEINITISKLSKSASLEHLNTVLMNTISQVRTEYFKLYNLREQLSVRRISLELARKILAETKARVSAGVLPAMEILNAEFGVASREKELIDAEKAVNDQVDTLRLLLQINEKVDVLTTGIPRRELLEINQVEALKYALSRPEILEQKKNLEINELQTRVYKNKILPDLSFNASGTLLGADRVYTRNLDRISGADYPAWSVGLVFSYPLGNNAAENDYRKSKLKNAQIALQLKNLEENAAYDVTTAIRSINSGFKQIEVADRGRKFAEERLRAFIRKNQVGLATTKDVLDVENDLATAKSNQISAVVNYDTAITKFYQVTGKLLEREGVRLLEADADKLYEEIR